MTESRAEASQSLSLIQRAPAYAPTSDMLIAELCSGNGDWLASACDFPRLTDEVMREAWESAVRHMEADGVDVEEFIRRAAAVLASSQELTVSAETALLIVEGKYPW